MTTINFNGLIPVIVGFIILLIVATIRIESQIRTAQIRRRKKTLDNGTAEPAFLELIDYNCGHFLYTGNTGLFVKELYYFLNTRSKNLVAIQDGPAGIVAVVEDATSPDHGKSQRVLYGYLVRHRREAERVVAQ